ncbi:MAG: hypothetical protein LIO96_07930 [Lachnospiraceae bacterium]|nr:hypothetical protein [Lachnospiraceae bacterium]
MVRKYVQINFTSPLVATIDKFDDIWKGVQSARLNLEVRHNVILRNLMICNNKVVLSLDVPDEIADGFSIGNHLRGISTWLLSNRSEYQGYVVGKRLLTYTEVTEPRADVKPVNHPVDIESKKLAELTEIRKELQNIRVILQSQYVPEYEIVEKAKRNKDGTRTPAKKVALEDPLGELHKRYNISQ